MDDSPSATPVGHPRAMNEIKTKKVTFSAGLPRGACATFTHEGQLWFAYPKDKVQGLGAVMDRMLGTISRLHNGLVGSTGILRMPSGCHCLSAVSPLRNSWPARKRRPGRRERSLKMSFRPRKKPAERTPEGVILDGLQQAHAMYPTRMMPITIIRSLKDAGYVIVSEAELDAEIALAFQAGEESERDR